MKTAEFLRGKGILPSPQRVRIWEILASTKAHPAADSIHRDLVPEMDTLSRTTVYSTLELFVSCGIAQKLTITGTESRFDANASPHAHFGCRSCGAVSDLPGPFSVATPPLPRGFLANRTLVFVEGLCAGCSTMPGPS
ncbi:MAG: transcriptional repressor [Spirochaetota bacterium]